MLRVSTSRFEAMASQRKNSHGVRRLRITPEELTAIEALVTQTASSYRSVEDQRFLKEVGVIAHDLPLRIRRFINNFRMGETGLGVCLVSGYSIDQLKIRKTPSDWHTKGQFSRTRQEEFFLILLGSLLGDVFGWATQQEGSIVHEVLPVKEHEDAQLGTGSNQDLWWHSEDAFHPYRADYVGLLCLRNPGCVRTTFASVDMLRLSKTQMEVLRQERFIILPDESHQEGNCDGGKHSALNTEYLLSSAYERIVRMKRDPRRVPLLFGNAEAPYFCLDAVYMRIAGADDEAQKALHDLVQAINASLEEIALEPGDCCFIDNYRTVHGRRAFRANYDGTDRWLKRINITRDLRKSRALRPSCSSRVIH